MPKVRVQQRGPGEQCPLCQDQLADEGQEFVCECGVRYHSACVQEMGGACVPGCKRELRAVPETREEESMRAGQGQGTGPSPVVYGCFLGFFVGPCVGQVLSIPVAVILQNAGYDKEVIELVMVGMAAACGVIAFLLPLLHPGLREWLRGPGGSK